MSLLTLIKSSLLFLIISCKLTSLFSFEHLIYLFISSFFTFSCLICSISLSYWCLNCSSKFALYSRFCLNNACSNLLVLLIVWIPVGIFIIRSLSSSIESIKLLKQIYSSFSSLYYFKSLFADLTTLFKVLIFNSLPMPIP